MDTITLRRKQKALVAELLERKIRLRAQQLYDNRGQTEGLALEDWIQAEAEVLGSSSMAPAYRKTKALSGDTPKPASEVLV